MELNAPEVTVDKSLSILLNFISRLPIILSQPLLSSSSSSSGAVSKNNNPSSTHSSRSSLEGSKYIDYFNGGNNNDIHSNNSNHNHNHNHNHNRNHSQDNRDSNGSLFIDQNSSPSQPSYPFVEFQLCLHVENPGLIVGYVDKQVPSTKALEISFPSIDIHTLYQYDYGKPQNLLPTISISIPTIILAPSVLDFVGVLMSGKKNADMSAKDSLNSMNSVRGGKMEEKPSGMLSPGFYVEKESTVVENDQCR